jgi:hypothetical protein
VCGRGTEKRGVCLRSRGLGRSRGGFSTKIVLTAIDENTPVAVEVLPGQVHEATQVEKMLDASQARLPQIEEAVADKGFDGEPSAASHGKSEHPAGDSLSSQSAKPGAC